MILEIILYRTSQGKVPFEKWLWTLKDSKTRQIIQARLDRAAFGNLGDVKSLGDEVSEIRISYGPGFRVYYSFQGQRLLLLLLGGDKKSQTKDIEKAKKYLKDWKIHG